MISMHTEPTVHYAAIITREGRNTLAEFPDCPGCQTFADPGESIADMAAEALTGWLEAHLVDGEAPPRPRRTALRAPHRARVMDVAVPALLGTRLQLRWARDDAGLSQAELGRRIGVSRQQVSLVEAPDTNPTVGTLERVAKALGMHLRIELRANPARPADVTPLRSRRTAPPRAPRRA